MSWKSALKEEKPLQIVGVTNAYIALMAHSLGFKALYLSGAATANGAFGLPDLGLTTMTEVAEEVRRISARVPLPLLVDIDNGWGSSLMVRRAVRLIEQGGAAALHIEDQAGFKRCGHLTNKRIVSKEKMADLIKAAVDSRINDTFLIMARTDAVAVEGMELALERVREYEAAGADLLFPEALTSLEQYQLFKKHCRLPLLANLTEFGMTPLFSKKELEQAQIDMALYPLSAFRAMNQAAYKLLETIRLEGTQKSFIDKMETREKLYQQLDYYGQEKIITNERE